VADSIAAWVHFMCIFAMVGTLFAEAFFYQPTLAVATLKRLQRVDIAFGILAGTVVASGIARIYISPKTPAFYMHDTIFWTKMALFVTLGLISIAPTMHLIRLGRQAPADGAVQIPPQSYATIRRLLTLEIVLLLFIPLCATLMAHGYGYR
jgi:putative membrane protein